MNSLEKIQYSLKKLSEKKIAIGWEDDYLSNLAKLLFYGEDAKRYIKNKKIRVRGRLPSRDVKEIFISNRSYIREHREVGIEKVGRKIPSLMINSPKSVYKSIGKFYWGKFKELLDYKNLKTSHGIKPNAPLTKKIKGFDNPLYQSGTFSEKLVYKVVKKKR